MGFMKKIFPITTKGLKIFNFLQNIYLFVKFKIKHNILFF